MARIDDREANGESFPFWYVIDRSLEMLLPDDPSCPSIDWLVCLPDDRKANDEIFSLGCYQSQSGNVTPLSPLKCVHLLVGLSVIIDDRKANDESFPLCYQS